jgi:hypothetical protein
MTVNDQETALFATFAEHERAVRFVEQLQRAGFRDNQIDMLGPGSEPPSLTEEGAAAGALSGVAPGALAGAAVAGLVPGAGPLIGGGILLGALGGAAAGGLLGALVGWGLSDEEVHHAERELMHGRTLVAVKGDRLADAMVILKNLGGSQLEAPRQQPPELVPLDRQPAG